MQSPSALHPQTPPLHWLPSGAFEQSVTQDPLEQQPPLQMGEALQEVEHEPPLHAIPAGQSVGPVHVPLSNGPTAGPSVPASRAASFDASLELPLDPPSEDPPSEHSPPELLPELPLDEPLPVASRPAAASEPVAAPSPVTSRPHAGRRRSTPANIARIRRIAPRR